VGVHKALYIDLSETSDEIRNQCSFIPSNQYTFIPSNPNGVFKPISVDIIFVRNQWWNQKPVV